MRCEKCGRVCGRGEREKEERGAARARHESVNVIDIRLVYSDLCSLFY